MTIVVIYVILKNIYKSKTKNRIELNKKISIFSPKRYFRYIKLFFNSKILITIAVFSIISNLFINFQENKYKKIYSDGENIEEKIIIISDKMEKTYNDIYKGKILRTNKILYIQVSKKININLEYGDIVNVKATFIEPNEQRNYGGFNYKLYLKTIKIYGTLKVEDIKLTDKNKGNIVISNINKFTNIIKDNIEKILPEKEAEVIKGILIGDTSGIDNEIRENFKISNLSHILAVSGMHVQYIIIIFSICNGVLGKKKTRIFTAIFLNIYMIISGLSPSIMRAVFMEIMVIGGHIFYRKNDFWNTLSLSILIILLNNPYLVLNSGFVLSYLGTIGIVVFNKTVLKILNSFKIRNKKWKYKINLKSAKLEKIKEILSVTISAQLMILPYMIYSFNIFSPYFIITNLLVCIIISPIIIIGILLISLSFISINLTQIFGFPLKILVDTLLLITKFSKLPCAKIYISTPSVFLLISTYIFTYIIYYVCKLKVNTKLTATQKRIKNLIAVAKYYCRVHRENIKKITYIIIFIIVVLKVIPKKLEINFVDVGQGDCTFIKTPYNKTILIDGGGSNINSGFDGGKNILLPYILDKGYTKIDYMLITHMDNDHIGNLFTILEELKVKKIIISKQGEDSENYKKLLDIVKKKKIKVLIVKEGDILKIENNLYFKILWPQEEQIKENILNNNSIVAKLNYHNFSMLFTGDIEKIAEEKMLEKYDNKDLKADILKIAHHGSKTSSIEEFVEKVNPKMALIGVGKNNLFKHPSDSTLETLNKNKIKIYRTDKNGEITIKVNRKGQYIVKEKINY